MPHYHRATFAGGDSDGQKPPPDHTIHELVAKVNALANAFNAFVESRAMEDRMMKARLRRLDDAERIRSERALIDQVSTAQVDTIKRVFKIEIIDCERQDTKQYDLGSPENAPYAWLVGMSTHDLIQVEGYMQYLRAHLTPCLDACGLKQIDVRGQDELLPVPLSVWSEFELSGSAHPAIVKRGSQWTVDLIQLVALINVFAPGEQGFSNGEIGAVGTHRQRIDDLAVTQLFAADALRPTCFLFVLNTGLAAGWRFYWMTPDSHGVKKRIVRQPKQALELLKKDICSWNK